MKNRFCLIFSVLVCFEFLLLSQTQAQVSPVRTRIDSTMSADKKTQLDILWKNFRNIYKTELNQQTLPIMDKDSRTPPDHVMRIMLLMALDKTPPANRFTEEEIRQANEIYKTYVRDDESKYIFINSLAKSFEPNTPVSLIASLVLAASAPFILVLWNLTLNILPESNKIPQTAHEIQTEYNIFSRLVYQLRNPNDPFTDHDIKRLSSEEVQKYLSKYEPKKTAALALLEKRRAINTAIERSKNNIAIFGAAIATIVAGGGLHYYTESSIPDIDTNDTIELKLNSLFDSVARAKFSTIYGSSN